jgi:hypothetical protein
VSNPKRTPADARVPRSRRSPSESSAASSIALSPARDANTTEAVDAFQACITSHPFFLQCKRNKQYLVEADDGRITTEPTTSPGQPASPATSDVDIVLRWRRFTKFAIFLNSHLRRQSEFHDQGDSVKK